MPRRRVEGSARRKVVLGVRDRRAGRPMTFGACGHVACEPCAWRHLLDGYERRGDADGSATARMGRVYPADAEWACRGARAQYSTSATTTTTTARLYASAPRRSRRSQTAVARALPVVKRQERRGPKRKVVQEVRRLGSQNVRAAALGTSRPKRTEAPSPRLSGNARRIRAIVAAGCDANCSDEYGLTPLMWARWRGKARP